MQKFSGRSKLLTNGQVFDNICYSQANTYSQSYLFLHEHVKFK